jgi:hypothetical protein
MHGPINVKSPNNNCKWQMGFNSAFKGLISLHVALAVCQLRFLNVLEVRGLNLFIVSRKCAGTQIGH